MRIVRKHLTTRSAPERGWWRPGAWSLLAVGLGTLALILVLAFAAAMREPIVREATVGLANWPAGQSPLRLVLVSDIHVAGPDMPPARVRRLVGQINRLSPDVVLLGGDFVSDKRVATRRYSLRNAIAPLAGIDATLGSFAVLGNHDHWRDSAAATAALSRAGIHVLDNAASRAGPMVIGGINDDFSGRADLAATQLAMERLGGAKVLLSHSPDPFPQLSADLGLMIAGHTHCGQISMPFVGAVATMSRFGKRYACGLVREGGKTLIVSAGVGTSLLPLRIGVPPDIWMITVGPK